MTTGGYVTDSDILLSLALRRSRPTPRAAALDDGWRGWLSALFPSYTRAPFAQRHIDAWEWAWGMEAGKRLQPFVGIWDRGGGKCLAADTEILRADGTRIPIRDIAIGDSILSLHERSGKIVRDRVIDKIVSGLKPCIRLTTRSGKSVRLTSAHKVLTFDGWKRAGEITLSDRIASPRYTRVDSYVERSDTEVRFLAYMLAEGGTTGKGCRWTNADPVIVADFITCAESLGFSVRKSGMYGYYISGAADWVRSMGLRGGYATTKRVPEWVYGLPERQKWAFLSAFIDTDGWIYVARGRVAITLANQKLIEDLQNLFTQVGVVTSVYHKKNKKSGAWELRVAQEYLDRCAENLHLILKHERLQEAVETHRYSLIDSYPSSIGFNLPYGVNRQLRDIGGLRLGLAYDVTRDKVRKALSIAPLHHWEWLEQADVFWDRVVRVEQDGATETFDVEIEHNHNLITDGLVTHNSTTAELIVVALGARKIRRYCLYVCMTQEQADDHVATIGALLESDAFGASYPEMAQRMMGKFGSSKGWRRNRLRTAGGFTVDALGLDTASRGIKIEDQRPDLIIIDDIDSEDDSTETTGKKMARLTRKVLPVGTDITAHMAIQNLVHPDSVFAQLADGRADMLNDRILSGPHPALLDAVYDEARGRIISGTPTWEGRPLSACQQFVTTWGLDAFRAECQHEAIALSGRFLPSMGLWDGCKVALPELGKHTRCVLAMDAGEASDTFARVLLAAHPTIPSGIAAHKPFAYVPDGEVLDFDEIEIDVRELGQQHAIQALVYDPFMLGQFIRRLQRPARLARKATPTVFVDYPAFPALMIPFPQGQARLESDKGLYDLVAERRFGHDGNEQLRAHMDNANVKKSADGRQWRIVKRRQSQKIDLAVATGMGAAHMATLLGIAPPSVAAPAMGQTSRWREG